MRVYPACCVLLLLPFWLFRGEPAQIGAWTGVVALAAAAAVIWGLSAHRPPERLPWHLALVATACVAATGAAAAAPRLGWGVGFPALPDVLLLAAAVPAAVVLLLFVRRSTSARDWAALADAAIVALASGCVLGAALVQPALASESLDRAASALVVADAVACLVLVAFATRLLLGARVGAVESSLLVAAVALQVLALVTGPLGAVHGWLLVASLLLPLAAAAQIAWGAAALHPGMWWLTQPGEAADPWPSRGRLVILASAVLTVLVVAGLEALFVPEPTRAWPIAACAALAVLLGVRFIGLAAGYSRISERERVLQEGAAALAVAKDHQEIRRAGIRTATELAGGVREAYVDVVLDSPPPLPELRDAVVVGSGEIAASLRGAIRRTGSVARVGAARTIIAPIVVHDRLQGVIRVTGARRLSGHLQSSLALLAGQIALAREGLEISDDLAEQRSEARFRSLVQNSNDLILVLEPDLTIRYTTPSSRALLGCEPGELVGSGLAECLHPDARDQVLACLGNVPPGRCVDQELRLRRTDGVFRFFEGTMSNLCDDPSVNGLVLTARDVSERRALEDELTRRAFHDALTGLANRALLADRVRHALERSARSHRDVALLFLDVDDFKTINDSLGHEAGDRLLVEVADRLRHCTRGSDTAARLGGDEFAIVLEETDGVEGAVAFAERVLAAIAVPVTIEGTQLEPRASIGISFGGSGKAAGELLRNADVAMYQAKRTGGGRFELYDPHMHEVALDRLELKADLRRAFRADRLDLAYQPIVDLLTGRTVGLEALLRWAHPVRGAVSPSVFVPLAEQSGLIGEIGHWVLERACRQVRDWQRATPGCEQLTANVNLSARQILEPGLPERVATVLGECGLSPGSLVLEITESSMMEDVDGVSALLAELRSTGIQIAIDDFGTGFSSLGYLQRFPVDELKVAKEFVDNVVFDARNARLVEAIVGLGAALGLRTLAEGIETPEQRLRLLGMGCMLGQGYLFARPLPADDVPALLLRDAAAAA